MVFGEESDPCDTCPSVLSKASFVMRHYWHSDCDKYGKRLMILPMGVINPIIHAPNVNLTRDTPASKRQFLFTFSSGHPNRVRSRIADQFWNHFKNSKANFSIRYGDLCLNSPLCAKLYGPSPEHSSAELRSATSAEMLDLKYMENLCSSRFVLVPRGLAEDTWRMGEGLFCGAIPVVTDGGEYYKHYMPQAVTSKFISLDADLNDESFQKAFRKIEFLNANPDMLDKHHAGLIQAWKDYNEAVREEMKTRLERTNLDR